MVKALQADAVKVSYKIMIAGTIIYIGTQENKVSHAIHILNGQNILPCPAVITLNTTFILLVIA